jgi:hypothetical protein
MKRGAPLFSKKFLRNAAIVLVIAVVAYVVMYGVREGFQASSTTVTQFAAVGNKGSAGDSIAITTMPAGKRLTDVKLFTYEPAARVTGTTNRTSCNPINDTKQYSTTPLRLGSTTIQMYIEVTKGASVINIFGSAPKGISSNTRVLNSNLEVGKPGGPPSVSDIAGGSVVLKNVTANAMGLHGKFSYTPAGSSGRPVAPARPGSAGRAGTPPPPPPPAPVQCPAITDASGNDVKIELTVV